ncbi:sulfotransferase [Paracoccus fontiphilus]|uniref:Sulfotransferase n=1 Tax=Paracoccus fontiphilus TaxID=1815556 RepID=A0ABV7IM94_9RHOB|nr:sulfotransferase [Paracoccus fontiphilus]
MTSDQNGKLGLIVTGVARSGTTALGKLLNAHAGVCLGIERYKFQFLRAHNYSADLFERERFFDFRAEDTNLIPDLRPAWKPTYDHIALKWGGARVIGDKVPDLMPVLRDFITQNPDFRYIVILRNLKDVGLSWQARADRPRDSWPKNKGFAEACESWDAQYRILHDIIRDRKLRKQVLLLDYDRMYEDVAETEAVLLGFLGLGRDPAFSEVLHEHAGFAATRGKRKIAPRFIEPYKAVEQGYAKGLRKVAREQARFWADRFASAGTETGTDA